MGEPVVALRAPLDENLLPLAVALSQRKIGHRIIEENGVQVVQVADTAHTQVVTELYSALQSGRLHVELRRRAASDPISVTRVWLFAPVTLLLILVSVVCFALLHVGDPTRMLQAMSFVPFTIEQGMPVFGELNTQYWRLVTPAFLHFGWMHIVFNCLWLWELGKRVEEVTGHFNHLMIVLTIAVVSNVAQFVYGGPALFGGMSGVVYGLLGFAWVAPLVYPRWAIRPQTGIMLFMIGWLVACMMGVMEVLGFGAIANAAHLGGLLCGAALGAVFGLRARAGNDSRGAGPL